MATQTVNQRPTLMSAPEAAWWSAAANAGDYSPIPGPHSLRFGGTLRGLASKYNVDTTSLSEGLKGPIQRAVDDQGRAWFARCYANFMWSAWRDLSDEELTAHIDAIIDDGRVMMPAVCLRAARHVNYTIGDVVVFLRPENVAPRHERRYMKKRLTQLVELQMELLSLHLRSSREIAQRMKAAGVYWQAVDYQAWLDRQHC